MTDLDELERLARAGHRMAIRGDDVLALIAELRAERAKVEEAEKREAVLRDALRSVIACNDEFRSTLPDDWESDPLNTLCDNLRHLTRDPELGRIPADALTKTGDA